MKLLIKNTTIQIQEDCFAYKFYENGSKECKCLTSLECEYRVCPFYKSSAVISSSDIERCIRQYNHTHKR